MPIRIERQKEMQAACRAVEFCYLCGTSLGTDEREAVEHVVARGSLGAPTGSTAWPVTLRVHARCDREQKKPHDELLIAVQRAHTRPLNQVPPSDRALFRQAIYKAEAQGVPSNVPAFDAESLLASCWAQIRGMHAALYRGYLPLATTHKAISPVPGFRTKSARSIGEQIGREAWFTERILNSAIAAILADEWDGITAWDGQVKYRCIWHLLGEDQPSRAMCLWILDTPDALTWAEVTTGTARPWHGIYRLESMPFGASQISDAAIDGFNAARDRDRELTALRQLFRIAGRPMGV